MSGCPKDMICHLPDPYQLDVVYSGETPIGGVDHIEVQRPRLDHLRPYIERLGCDGGITVSQISQGAGWDLVSKC